jgi:hypothetical protein
MRCRRLDVNYSLGNVADSSSDTMVGHSKKRPARRCLFGPVDPADTDAVLSEMSSHSEGQANEKWGFDFRAGRPLPGVHRYEWTPVAGAEYIPPAYSSMVSLNNDVTIPLSDSSLSSTVESVCNNVAAASSAEACQNSSIPLNCTCNGSSSAEVESHTLNNSQLSVVEEPVETIEKGGHKS